MARTSSEPLTARLGRAAATPEDLSFSGEYVAIDDEGFTSTESFDNIPGAGYVARITLTEIDG